VNQQSRAAAWHRRPCAAQPADAPAPSRIRRIVDFACLDVTAESGAASDSPYAICSPLRALPSRKNQRASKSSVAPFRSAATSYRPSTSVRWRRVPTCPSPLSRSSSCLTKILINISGSVSASASPGGRHPSENVLPATLTPREQTTLRARCTLRQCRAASKQQPSKIFFFLLGSPETYQLGCLKNTSDDNL
jgi:hypothetical protein